MRGRMGPGLKAEGRRVKSEGRRLIKEKRIILHIVPKYLDTHQ